MGSGGADGCAGNWGWQRAQQAKSRIEVAHGPETGLACFCVPVHVRVHVHGCALGTSAQHHHHPRPLSHLSRPSARTACRPTTTTATITTKPGGAPMEKPHQSIGRQTPARPTPPTPPTLRCSPTRPASSTTLPFAMPRARTRSNSCSPRASRPRTSRRCWRGNSPHGIQARHLIFQTPASAHG